MLYVASLVASAAFGQQGAHGIVDSVANLLTDATRSVQSFHE